MLFYSLSLPHLTVQVFVDMSLVPNLSKTCVSFNSISPKAELETKAIVSVDSTSENTGVKEGMHY